MAHLLGEEIVQDPSDTVMSWEQIMLGADAPAVAVAPKVVAVDKGQSVPTVPQAVPFDNIRDIATAMNRPVETEQARNARLQAEYANMQAMRIGAAGIASAIGGIAGVLLWKKHRIAGFFLGSFLTAPIGYGIGQIAAANYNANNAKNAGSK